MDKKVVIITGASSGIGKVAARRLVEEGYHVILACRNEEKTQEVINGIKSSTGKDSLEYMQLNLASFKSIRKFVDDFHQKNLPLDILINNAGISMGSGALTLTEDGWETTFQTNHLGPFLLTNLLTEDLKKSAPSKVVIVSSAVHNPRKGSGAKPSFLWTKEEINDPKNFHSMTYYRNSKLANIWFCYELAERLASFNVSVNCLSPGLVPTTGLFDASNLYIRFLMRWILYYFPFARTEEQGGDTIVYAATQDIGSSNYLENNTKVASSEESKDKEKAKKLWSLSEEWTQ